MFWNMDVGEQEQDLMEISHFLLSVFEFAKNPAGKCVSKRGLAGLFTGERHLVLPVV